VGAVDDYFATLDAETRAAFEHVRKLALELAPDASQGTSYGVVALMHEGRGLLGFYAAKRHLSVFPYSGKAVDAVRDRLEAFDLASGTIRFTAAHPLPDDAVRELVRFRLAEIEARGGGAR
jgi:uncharacterized protein YdhG (YjbR/CyaY superfamily)